MIAPINVNNRLSKTDVTREEDTKRSQNWKSHYYWNKKFNIQTVLSFLVLSKMQFSYSSEADIEALKVERNIQRHI